MKKFDRESFIYSFVYNFKNNAIIHYNMKNYSYSFFFHLNILLVDFQNLVYELFF